MIGKNTMGGVTVINLAHPLTVEQREQIAQLTGGPLAQVIDVPPQFDAAARFAPQLVELLATPGLTAEEWQTLSLVINPPCFAPIVALLVAKLYGVTGHFPTIVRLAQVPGALPARFAVAEPIDLQAERDEARLMRTKG